MTKIKDGAEAAGTVVAGAIWLIFICGFGFLFAAGFMGKL